MGDVILLVRDYITFLIAVIKCLTKATYKRKDLLWLMVYEGMQSIKVGKAWKQDLEVTGHTESLVRKQSADRKGRAIKS